MYIKCHSPSAKNLFISVEVKSIQDPLPTVGRGSRLGVSGEQNTAVVGSGVGGGFMSQHCGCGRVIEAAMRKLVSCPQHCHMVSLGPHCSHAAP